MTEGLYQIHATGIVIKYKFHIVTPDYIECVYVQEISSYLIKWVINPLYH